MIKVTLKGDFARSPAHAGTWQSVSTLPLFISMKGQGFLGEVPGLPGRLLRSRTCGTPRNSPSSQITVSRWFLEQTLAMITVALKGDFARSEATWQSVSPLPKFLSTKGQGFLGEVPGLPGRLLRSRTCGTPRNSPSSQITVSRWFLEQTLAMITVALKGDFARSEATWQSVSPLPKFLSTKGQGFLGEVPGLPGRLLRRCTPRNSPSSLITVSRWFLEQTLAMITVTLKGDFARSVAMWQSISTLPKFLSTKG